MSTSIHGSSVHSVRARVTVSSGGPWYPDARARVRPGVATPARAVLMRVTLPPSRPAGPQQVRCQGGRRPRASAWPGRTGLKLAGHAGLKLTGRTGLKERNLVPHVARGLRAALIGAGVATLAVGVLASAAAARVITGQASAARDGIGGTHPAWATGSARMSSRP